MSLFGDKLTAYISSKLLKPESTHCLSRDKLTRYISINVLQLITNGHGILSSGCEKQPAGYISALVQVHVSQVQFSPHLQWDFPLAASSIFEQLHGLQLQCSPHLQNACPPLVWSDGGAVLPTPHLQSTQAQVSPHPHPGLRTLDILDYLLVL